MVDKEIRKKISLLEDNLVTKNFKHPLLSNMKSLKKKKIFTPNLNVERKLRNARTLQAEKLDEKKRFDINRRNSKKEKCFQQGEVFWGARRDSKPASTIKPIMNRDKVKKIKVAGLLLSGNRLESPPASDDSCEEIEENDEYEKLEPKDVKFCQEPLELVNSIQQKLDIDIKIKDEEDLFVSEHFYSFRDDELTTVKEKTAFVPFPLGNDSNHPGLTVFKLPEYISCKNKTEGVTVNELREGKLGKLYIRRSGKIEAYLGKLKCAVDCLDFMTESTVVNFDNSHDTPSLVLLGSVRNWFNIVPTWNNMRK